MELRHSRELQQKRNQVGVIINEGDRNVLFFAIKGKGVLMYRKVKKIVIVPLLIITVLCCMLYTDYRKPMEVQAVVMTGNPFADMFGWALELVGFSGKNKESQDQALHNFVQYIYKELHDIKVSTEQMEEGRKEQFDADCKKWRSDMEKKWSSMSEKERIINCFNSYTEAEYTKSGTKESYYVWVKENYVNCTSNPFKEETVAIPLRLIIANAIRDGKISSKYTAEQWEQSGTLGILTMSVRDWISGISKDIYGAAEEIWNNTLGSIINTANLQNMAWYKFVSSDEYADMIDHFTYDNRTDTVRDFAKTAMHVFLNDVSSDCYSYLKDIGNKYILKIAISYSTAWPDNISEFALSFIDVPEETSVLKTHYYGTMYDYQFYDSSGKSLAYDKSLFRLWLYYVDGDKAFRSSGFSETYHSYVPFALNCINVVNDKRNSNSSDCFQLFIPFGLNDVSIDDTYWQYAPPDVYSRDSADDDDPAVVTPPFDLVVTGRGDSLADKSAGTVIDLDDVSDDSIPHDEVIDPALTDEKVAAREQENDKVITDAKLRADERIKEEAKDDAGTDVKPGEDTKDEDLDKYKIKVIDIFPFCIPFDIYRFFSCLAADPVAPKFTIPVITENSFGIPEYSIEIDFAMFDTVAAILRKMELLGFCVGLAFATNKLIKH